VKIYKFLSVVLILIQSYQVCSQQEASITSKVMSIDTYYFDNPNPIPILAENPKIYPYFTFKGYQYKAKKKNWKVITLENKYIKLYVLPQVGGKIWGAIEKKTGKEFIYKNKVLKFRNIAMRGPWTSGGIEFNFGIIGHTPTTATPVDYRIKNNDDGSVSCIVGTIDLPSRTQWSVEINLQRDKAYFETKASWYNATPLHQSYYNWMTAAAAAKDDLEFFAPGNKYLKHNGEAMPWSIDKEGRQLSMYKNNNFDGHKSYHVVGDYHHFFGGYYHNSNFGFGHWAPYEEMPGQKLWLWALSREGGIWENLLTDTNGQYIEFQAGRLLNQYFPGKMKTPITQVSFDPYVMDRWSDSWFPFKEINGMVDASKYGVLNVEHKNNNLYIGINALQTLKETVTVLVNNTEIYNEKIALQPMEVFFKNIPLKKIGKIEVFIGDKLQYSNSNETLLKRPFHTAKNVKITPIQQLYSQGWEAVKYRDYKLAYQKFSEVIRLDPSHREALLKLAALDYRKTDYKKGLAYVNRVLKMNTYHSEANYLAGVLYRATYDYINALESFGWSARDMKYRSVSYAQMAEIYILQHDAQKAERYARKALDYNTYNLNAKHILLLLARKQKRDKDFSKQAKELLTMAPLDHFVAIETALRNGKSASKSSVMHGIQNEFKAETVLELALDYCHLGLYDEALYTLSLTPNDVKIKLWQAYLLKDRDSVQSTILLTKVQALSPDFVFPYRRETIEVLKWALQQKPHWKLKYFLALNEIGVGNDKMGKQLLMACENEPNSAAFYAFRGQMVKNNPYQNRLKDYQKAIQLDSKKPILWNALIQFSLKNANPEKTYAITKKAYNKFPKNYDIAMGYSMALLKVKKYKECLNILKNSKVLPSELARKSRTIYYEATVSLANQFIKQKKYTKAIQLLEKSKEWPENLGVGKPYDVDTRLQDFLLAVCYEKRDNLKNREAYLKAAIEYTNTHQETASANHLFGLLALKKHSNKNSQQHLQTLLKGLKENKDIKNQLALAFFSGNSNKLHLLKQKHIVSKRIWTILGDATNY